MFPGLICAEGEAWREQRKFVTTCLKDFGMVKFSCSKRDKLEGRIIKAVNEAVLVKLYLFLLLRC